MGKNTNGFSRLDLEIPTNIFYTKGWFCLKTLDRSERICLMKCSYSTWLLKAQTNLETAATIGTMR